MSDTIAVIDVGATNTRVVLLDAQLNEIESRKAPTNHINGPNYKTIDHQTLVSFVCESLIALDAIRPIDTISISAFGATLALVDQRGKLAAPIMDYLSEVPADIDQSYRKIAPPFSEVYSHTSPGALTLAKQIYWIETEFPELFENVQMALPFSSFIAYAIGGAAATEVSNLGVFTHLINARTTDWSSLVKMRGWTRLFPARRNAWDIVGIFREPKTGRKLLGKGEILAGIHDSNANWLRYLAGQEGHFTLLSTGTFVIGFDSDAKLDALNPATDNFSFNDIFGRPICCARFYGGYEFSKLLDGASAQDATYSRILKIIKDSTLALPAFSDTGGPIAGRGNRGRVIGGQPSDNAGKASLATLYYALMIDRVLDGLHSQSNIIIDGPVARNPLLMSLICDLRPHQAIFASSLSEGTTLGAGVLGQMKSTGILPKLQMSLVEQSAAKAAGLIEYRNKWLAQIRKDS